MPELQKKKGRRAKLRQKTLRLRRRRIHASGLRDNEGRLLADAGRVGAELCGQWGPVITGPGEERDEAWVADVFLRCIVRVPPEEWELTASVLRRRRSTRRTVVLARTACTTPRGVTRQRSCGTPWRRWLSA